jgi:protein-disulfide isomerase
MSIKHSKRDKQDNLSIKLVGFLFLIFLLIMTSLIIIKPNNAEIIALAETNTLKHVKFGTGSIVITEFADLQCPACSVYHSFMKQYLKENPALNFEFKHFPLTNIHRNAETMAKYSIAISTISPNKFWPFLNHVYKNQQYWSKLSIEKLHNYVEKTLKLNINVNYEMVFKRLESKTVLAKLASDKLEAKNLKLRGTPTFLVNGKIIKTPAPNRESWDKLIKKL